MALEKYVDLIRIEEEDDYISSQVLRSEDGTFGFVKT